MKRILRPLTPPLSLTFLKYAASTLPIVAYAEAGPLYGIVWPILISLLPCPSALAAAPGLASPPLSFCLQLQRASASMRDATPSGTLLDVSLFMTSPVVMLGD